MMYLQALSLSVIFASIIFGMQTIALTSTSAVRANRIDRVLGTQIGAAREAFRFALASAVENIGPAGPFTLHTASAMRPICPPAASGASPPPCPFQVEMEATTVGDTTQPADVTTGNETAENIQTASFVGEQRVSAIVTINLFSADGSTQIAQRREIVTARTFAVAPWAMISGATDLSSTAGLSSEGDSAGCDPANGTSCFAQPLTSAPDDTRIHASVCVVLTNGICTSAASADNFSSIQWQNPNSTTEQGWRF